MTFPHAAAPGGYVTSPLQSPYLTSPMAPMNPALMSLFPATSPDQSGPPVSAFGSAGHGADVAASRQVQMQAALSAALMPSVNQSAAAAAAAAANHHHNTFSQQQHQQLILNKAKSDRVEVNTARCRSLSSLPASVTPEDQITHATPS